MIKFLNNIDRFVHRILEAMCSIFLAAMVGFTLYNVTMRYGFNNPDTEWDKEEIEYLLIGDSFVHGACVNRPNDISSVLRNLSKAALINL